MTPTETAKKIINEIKNANNIDVTDNIAIFGHTICLRNNGNFDFNKIFIISKKNFSPENINHMMPIGKHKKYDILVHQNYCEIMINYYVIYNEKENIFILFALS